MSIGPPAKKLSPNQIFGRFPHSNYNITRNGLQNVIYYAKNCSGGPSNLQELVVYFWDTLLYIVSYAAQYG